MFDLSSSWVWDYWFADDGETYHLFFLYASRALHDPDARHYRASVGHAVSDDLITWTPVADAIVRGEAGSFDDLATWTGSTVRGGDGRWQERPADRLCDLARPHGVDEGAGAAAVGIRPLVRDAR